MDNRLDNDQPAKTDLLDRSHYARTFAKLVHECVPPFVVGLYGTWGVGKTTLINLIIEELDGTALVVRYNAWAHQFDQEPAVALLHEMVDQLGLPNTRKTRNLLTTIGKALGSAIVTKITKLDGAELIRFINQYGGNPYEVREARAELRAALQELIKRAQSHGDQENPKRIAFFIDDLDRCAPTAVLSVLEALKIYLDIEDCVYFLAADRAVVERAVADHYRELGVNEVSYLEKIVQLSFNIPAIPTEAIERFIAPILPSELSKECLPVLTKGLGANPRQVKRFINVLIFNHELAKQSRLLQYHPVTLAALLLIQHRDPELYQKIEKEPSILIDALHNRESQLMEIAPRDDDLRAGLLAAASYIPTDSNRLRGYFHLAARTVMPEERSPARPTRHVLDERITSRPRAHKSQTLESVSTVDRSVEHDSWGTGGYQ